MPGTSTITPQRTIPIHLTTWPVRIRRENADTAILIAPPNPAFPEAFRRIPDAQRTDQLHQLQVLRSHRLCKRRASGRNAGAHPPLEEALRTRLPPLRETG